MADNRPNWMVEHIDRYLKSNGEDGHLWNGVPCLLLSTTGCKSGETRLIPLIYGELDDSYIIVASKGGHTHHPSWYLNLASNPEVEIQVKADKMKGRCKVVEGDERARCWEIMTGIWPAYNEYEARTDRHIPVVVITPHN